MHNYIFAYKTETETARVVSFEDALSDSALGADLDVINANEHTCDSSIYSCDYIIKV